MKGYQIMFLALLISGMFLLIQANEHPKDCGLVCKCYCQYGNVHDTRGCPTCKCIEHGYKCGPVCKKSCPYGFQTDAKGCPICKCKVVDKCQQRCRAYCNTKKNQPYDCVCDCGKY